MNSLYSIPALNDRADLASFAVVNGNIEVVYGHRPQPRHTIDRRPTIDGRLEDRFVECFVEAGEQPRAPILPQDSERAEEGVRPPVRDPGHNQMPRRGDASDRLAVVDMLRDQ